MQQIFIGEYNHWSVLCQMLQDWSNINGFLLNIQSVAGGWLKFWAHPNMILPENWPIIMMIAKIWIHTNGDCGVDVTNAKTAQKIAQVNGPSAGKREETKINMKTQENRFKIDVQYLVPNPCSVQIWPKYRRNSCRWRRDNTIITQDIPQSQSKRCLKCTNV